MHLYGPTGNCQSQACAALSDGLRYGANKRHEDGFQHVVWHSAPAIGNGYGNPPNFHSSEK